MRCIQFNWILFILLGKVFFIWPILEMCTNDSSIERDCDNYRFIVYHYGGNKRTGIIGLSPKNDY